MANSYSSQSFAPSGGQIYGGNSPVITSDQKFGADLANQNTSQAISGITDIAMKQQSKINDMNTSLGSSLLQAKLNRILYPNNPMYGNADSDPKIDAMLSANPYTRQMLTRMNASLGQASQAQQPQPGQGTLSIVPSTMPSSAGTSSSSGGGSVNPAMGIQSLGGGQSSSSGGSVNPVNGNVVTGGSTEFKGPMGSMSQNYTNLDAAAQEAKVKAQAEANVKVPAEYATNIAGSQAKEDTATSTLIGMTKNLVADLKSSQIESGGGGPIMGRLANVSTFAGGSPATFGLHNTIRDTAMAYARNLAGGSQGVQRLYKDIADTIPDEDATAPQAGTAMLQMYLTARQIDSGLDNMGLTLPALKNMNYQQVQDVMAKGSIDRNAETKTFAGIMSKIQPTQVSDLNGKLSSPQPNFFAKIAQGWEQKTPSSGSQNPVNSAKSSQTSLPKGLTPQIIQNAPKWATHWSPTKGYTDANGNTQNVATK